MDEENKVKAKLIKKNKIKQEDSVASQFAAETQIVSPPQNSNAESQSETAVSEKRKIVLVKKKTVKIVKVQPVKTPVVPEPEPQPQIEKEPAETKPTVNNIKPSSQRAANTTINTGPVIIKATENLPPIKPVTRTNVSGSRQVGYVGGVEYGEDGQKILRYPKNSNKNQSKNQPNQGIYTPRSSQTNTRVNVTGKTGNPKFTPFFPTEKISDGKNKRVFYKDKGKDRRHETTEDEFEMKQFGKKKSLEPAAIVSKNINIMSTITVADLAKKMNIKASEIISKLFSMGMLVTMNETIDSDTATIIASEYGCQVHLIDLYEETIIPGTKDKEEDLIPRAPVVTVMGHVDHGKTKLLDAIRQTNITAGEFGGITQHIGAYKVSIKDKGDIVFLDTPGHAAFTMMRARGAQITDIVVLVVAANDGVMPQTIEAIDHAKAAKCPIIVAINKCDLPESKPERVMQQLSEKGLVPEQWGGSTIFCQISALKQEGIDNLLESILLQAEIMELKANPNCNAEGKIIEARIDPGRGTVATVIVQRGTLHQNDYYVAGIYAGKVRAMFDDKGNRITKAGPSTPVEVIGLSDIPGAGDPFQVCDDEKQARSVGSKRQELERQNRAGKYKKVTMDNMFDVMKEGDIKELNIVIKGDVQGSVEALQLALEKLSTPEIRVCVVRAAAGAIIEDDINLASASENPALVIGFNVRPTPKAQARADEEHVEIRKYNVIYSVVDDIKRAMEGMLSPEKTEVDIGTAQVRQVFKVPKIGLIAGCFITSGVVRRNCRCRIIRNNIQLSKELLKITSLKRFKDDVKEVASGLECGVGIENFQDLREDDTIEFVEIKETARKLDISEEYL